MAKKSFGQHFLVNPGAADTIVAAAEVQAGDRVLEIGPGKGVLTERLLKTEARVTAIEADRDLEFELRYRFPSLELFIADATRYDYATLGEGPFTLVSNLPYNVSKPLLMRFFGERRRFKRWVLMMQKEVADRITAKPGTKDWAPLGILMQNVCAVRRIAQLGPRSFNPPPKVDSTVLRFDVLDEPLVAMGDEKCFGDALFDLFRERRKTLNNRFKSLGIEASPLLERFALTGTERAEALPRETVLELAREIGNG